MRLSDKIMERKYTLITEGQSGWVFCGQIPKSGQ